MMKSVVAMNELTGGGGVRVRPGVEVESEGSSS
jgi:hypothetical protein